MDKTAGVADVPEWFTGSRLNFAENLLKHSDDRVAIYSTSKCTACDLFCKSYSIEYEISSGNCRIELRSLGPVSLDLVNSFEAPLTFLMFYSHPEHDVVELRRVTIGTVSRTFQVKNVRMTVTNTSSTREVSSTRPQWGGGGGVTNTSSTREVSSTRPQWGGGGFTNTSSTREVSLVGGEGEKV